MTESEAYRVLGLPENTGPEHIRTRYRELIVQVHPDKVRRRSAQSSDLPCRESETDSQEHQAAPFTTPHDARIINQAYNLLQRSWRKTRNSQEARASSDGQDFQKKTAQSTGKGDAPCNPYAYHPREIYCRAKDTEGLPIGFFTIARGKYLWSQDEEFPLFLKSVYQCGSELLKEADASQKREADDSRRQRALGELTYLLAQQFIDVRSSLDELAKAVTIGDTETCLILYMENRKALCRGTSNGFQQQSQRRWPVA
ncbi:DnaJ domain-containing protein [Sarcina sp. DSM 11001]|nr:J domain-containing protein [Sarcina sp. DSM 11001]SDL76858.1 DnaJ domain-containing protein [Sarcina sp. DSM 11001]